MAAVLRGPHALSVEEVPEPRPGPGWVRLAVKAVGICGTDKAFYTGTYRPGKLPIILGHEVSGVVDEVGPGVPDDLVGALATTEINVVCGRCWFCTHGLREHCPNRRAIGISMDGGMAEFLVVPHENIHTIEGLSPQEGVFVEPLAAVLKMVQLEPPVPGANVAVLGIGTIGLLAIQVLKLSAPSLLVAVCRPGSPKARLARALGADHVLTFGEALELAREATPEGQGFDYVVEATGSPQGLNMAVELARPRGTVMAKSTHGAPVAFDYTAAVVKELRVVGSRCGPFEPAIRMLRERVVRVADLITATYRLEDAEEAMRRSLERGQVKVQVLIGA